MEENKLDIGVEYNELVTKKGKDIIFLNLEEFLLHTYGARSMEEIKPKAVNGEYIVHCPFCKHEGHTKHKLYIKDDLTKGNCFVCGRAWVNVDDTLNLEFEVPDTLCNFGMGPQPLNLIKLEDPEWSLEKYKFECDVFDQKGYDYLIDRHPYMADLYKALGFKFLDGNIVMPFFYNGEVFYYQIRFSNKNNKIRYFFPPMPNGGKPPYIIDHGKGLTKAILCEGIFDAISLLIQAPDYIPIALMGSSLSDYQMQFLRERTWSAIKIYMDETSISLKIANRLKSCIDYCPISIIKSDGEDPEECMIRKMRRWPGSEVGWIK